MSETNRIYSSVESVHKTLEIRDSKNITICVGSAAIAVCLAEIGVMVNDVYDVDVLCPNDYFDSIVHGDKSMRGVDYIKLRSPKEPYRAMGATSQSIDIYPSTKARAEGVIPFTACKSMSDLLFPISYDEVLVQPNRIVDINDIRCLNLPEVLRWLAVVAREKDIDKINEVLPAAHDAGLVSDVDKCKIIGELEYSLELRRKSPERYCPRLPFTASELGY